MTSISTGKLLAFATVVCVFGLLPYLHYEHFQSAGLQRSLPEAAALLPARIGDFASVEHWTYPLARYTGIEQGATYQEGQNPRKVQYDMWLGNLDARHNGIACYLAQGSEVLWQKSNTVQTSDSEAVFGLALLRDDSVDGKRLKLVAASECSPHGCQEDALVAHGWEFSPQALSRFFQPNGISLPVSVTLTGPDEDAERALLQEALTHFMRGISLRPIQAFSALESGAS